MEKERFEFRIFFFEDTWSDEDLDRDDRKIHDKEIKACINGYRLQRKWINWIFFLQLWLFYSQQFHDQSSMDKNMKSKI